MMNYFNLIFSNNSLLRIFQNQEFNKFKLKGLCLEFGANHKIDRNFLKKNSKKYKAIFSNIEKKDKSFLFLDLEKKTSHKKKYDNIVIFNVLEHIFDIKTPLDNIYSLLKKNGKIIGSTPFLYRIHGAPNDYNRYSKEYLKEALKQKKFKNIDIKEIGLGPFLASFSLLRGYLKYIPLLYQFLLIFFIIIDKLLFLLMKNDPKLIYPIGYIFSAVKK